MNLNIEIVIDNLEDRGWECFNRDYRSGVFAFRKDGKAVFVYTKPSSVIKEKIVTRALYSSVGSTQTANKLIIEFDKEPHLKFLKQVQTKFNSEISFSDFYSDFLTKE